MHNLTLGHVLSENRRTHRTITAVVCGADRYTYADLADRVDRLANNLTEAGVSAGDRVLWMGQNCHRILELLLAVAKIGASVCPINWRQSAEEFAFIVDDLRPTIVFWQNAAIGATVQRARELTSHDTRWIRHDGTDGGESYESFLSAGEPHCADIEVDPMSAVLIMYTAAFDGVPNGAMLTQTGLLLQNANLLKLMDIWRGFVYLACGPLFHIGAFRHILATFHIGGTNVFTSRAEPLEIMELIARERCVSGMVLPPTIAKIVELNRDRKYDLSSFRSGLRMPGWDDMVQPDNSPSGRAIGGYGQTELHGLDVYAAYGRRDGVSTAGLPSPYTRVRIVDETGVEVPEGTAGEMVFYGPLVHLGYWNRPELNAFRTRSGGWHSGDIGRREEDGIITFIGPLAQMIKSGVENIYPAEVEACIERMPGVSEAAIIGVPDEKFIQSVKAIVAVERGTAVTAEAVIDHCQRSIASYKKPRSVEFIVALPRTASGVVDYAALDAAFGGGGYPGGRTRSH